MLTVLQEPVKFNQLRESAEATRENCCRSPLCILRSEPLNEWNMLSRCYRLSTEEFALSLGKSPMMFQCRQLNSMLFNAQENTALVTSGIDCTFMSGVVVSKYLWYFNHGSGELGTRAVWGAEGLQWKRPESTGSLGWEFRVNVSGHVSPVPYPLLWMVKWSTAVNEILYKSDVTVAN